MGLLHLNELKPKQCFDFRSKKYASFNDRSASSGIKERLQFYKQDFMGLSVPGFECMESLLRAARALCYKFRQKNSIEGSSCGINRLLFIYHCLDMHLEYL